MGVHRGLAHMDQHLGASITMSFALVVVFAIVLYQPEDPPVPAPTPETSPVAARGPPGTPTDPMPPLTPDEPIPDPAPGPTSVPSPLPTNEEVEEIPEDGTRPGVADRDATGTIPQATASNLVP